MRIAYHEFKPSLQLAPFIECYWLQTFEGKPGEESPVQKCLPLGMLEILIHLDGKQSKILQNGVWYNLPEAFFTGLYSVPVLWKAAGSLRLFGIRLKPEAFARFFGVSATGLSDNFTELGNLLGNTISGFTQQLFYKDINEVIRHTECFLVYRLKETAIKKCHVSEAMKLIRDTAGTVSIEEISTKLSVSTRQLQRCFKDHIGTTPKSYQRIIRFRNALSALNSPSSWTDITYGLGYADQAHFIREFKQFAGEAPLSVYRNAESYYKKPFEFTAAGII